MRDLKQGCFEPKPWRRVFIPKGLGLLRPSGIPAVRDRVARGAISPLLANIVLNALDWHLEASGFRFVRYADDFVILSLSHVQAQEALVCADRFLAPIRSG